ncbi:efflux transporter outer membrane subunit [Photobacterium sp. OFAV2-7]|uniref:efflux transporter outer membrane subunit n=1 Tax=Photobacterium sp. OFAV2-7 TaxID=2917748 RepID=UPI001EF69DB6|nr:efflux transporter outer membrane subunit [Photobacterium sp. OFAV2-7]MCG7588515.1 efflux transporter outer membrane subunit [Photobacterium sp. OFAV2-7]
MKLRKLSPIVVALILSGCATGPDYQPPEQTLDTEYLYQQTAGISQQAALASTSPWWYQFNDTMLNQLVADAQQQNIPLKIAAERIKAAQAYQQMVESFKVPTVSLGAGYSSFGLSENDPLLGPVVSSNNPLGTALVDSNQEAFHAGATIAWEMDLFGRIDKQAQAAAIRKEQADIFREGLTTMITSDVIHNYLQMRGAQARKAIAADMVRDQEETLALIEKMLRSGYGSELDLARAKAMLAATKSVIPQLQTAESVHQQRLAILLGETPAGMKARLSQSQLLSASQPVPELSGIIPTGLPSDLLQRRPDIRIAEREMAAVNAELGAAIANQYPKFYLTGAPGLLAKDFDDLFSSDSATWIANIGVSWNLFDGGRNEALIDIQEARFKSSALSYQHAVNGAIGEVETLLNGYGNSQQYQTLVLESKTETDKAVKKAKSLYAAGLVDYLTVLDAQRQQHIMADRVIAAKLQTANLATGLNKALGGDWELQ